MSYPLLIISFFLLFLKSIEKVCPDGCSNYCPGSNEEYPCSYCYSGYYEIKDPNSIYYKCGKCKAEHCSTCLPETINKCSSCASHYYFEGEICKECDANCNGCKSIPTNCTSCYTGNYLYNATCLLCDSNCHGCETTATHCTSCKSGEYVSAQATCLPCDSNCIECETEATHCTSCKSGEYVSAQATCLPCDSNCKTCVTEDTHCTSCKSSGEYISKDNICLLCDSNCVTCQSTATHCLSCNSGEYLSSNNACLKCPNICNECISESECTSCISNYFLYNSECLQCNFNCKTTSNSCKCSTCEDGYYIKNYQCLQCDSLCKTCSQQDLCIQCIDNYYKKEDDPLNNGQNIKCYKTPEGYYLDNDIYKKCYQSCKKCDIGGNKTFHNCFECDVNLSFELKRNNYINCYENCSNYYYFDSEDNFYCTFNLSCPYEYPYLLENKYECIEMNLDDILDYLLSNGLNGTESREEEILFYDNILSNLEYGFTSETFDTSNIENGIDQILKTEKLTITFSTTKNQKNNINKNMTTIDLGECEILLRKFYNISDNEPLYMKKIDVIQDGMKAMKIEYDVYARLFGKNLINLNLTICDKSKISISIPITINEELDKINSSGAYYNDICYTTTSEDGTDIIMKDRQSEFIDKDLIVCQDGCFLSNYDYNNSKAKCSCNVKKCSESYADMNINKAKILDNFKNINNLINFKFLICHKKLFIKEGILNNIGCYIISLIIIFHIITIFIFGLKQYSSLIKKIEKIVYEKYGKYEHHHVKENNNKKAKIVKPKVEPIIYEIYKGLSPNKIFCEKKDIKNASDNKLKIIIKDLKINKYKEKKIKEKNIKSYIDEEINGFSYELSLKIDKRTYCQYYISLLKTQHNLMCALFNNNDYNSGIIKIDLFIIGFTIEYTINALFYNDNTMHKIYQDKGLFDLETQLPIALYSTIISTILNYPLNYLALSNDAIINFKQDTSKINIRQKVKKLKKILVIKFTLYYIISFLFLLFFWYYVSMFCVIYKNTQMHLLKDTLMSIGLSLIFPFFIYLLPGIFRLPSLSTYNKKRECLYNFSKVLQSF